MPLTGLSYAISAAVTWGLVYTIDQRILRNTTPFTLLFVNSLITVAILLPFIFLERKEFAAPRPAPRFSSAARS
ncbi:MAG: EamA family transporter [Candidatus Liptonbacteria bacterium]|nr:EamA family transporter [Candidatus Liptonbacteria bacterium]